MKSSSVIRMGVAVLLTFTCHLSICTGDMTPVPARLGNDKSLEKHKLPMSPSSTPGLASTSTSISSSAYATSVTIKIVAATSSVTANSQTLAKKLSEKAIELFTLQNEFSAKMTAHHTFLGEKLAFVNATLQEIATTITVAQSGTHFRGEGRAKDADFLQKILFSENGTPDLEQLLDYLKTTAGDNQQLNFPALMKSVKDIVEAVKDIEREMIVWEHYVREVEGRVEELVKDVEVKMEVAGESEDDDEDRTGWSEKLLIQSDLEQTGSSVDVYLRQWTSASANRSAYLQHHLNTIRALDHTLQYFQRAAKMHMLHLHPLSLPRT
ncbi:hypothetical protein BKA65DRAFT_559758 [Rhexocercosporidium sp. MPI-PUGE-AT-0058]|nr:hypothetical protein BKA65DRAFT_559758 [Rhexocercosporidium sp. MPI-PUGE-AT-0058]